MAERDVVIAGWAAISRQMAAEIQDDIDRRHAAEEALLRALADEDGQGVRHD